MIAFPAQDSPGRNPLGSRSFSFDQNRCPRRHGDIHWLSSKQNSCRHQRTGVRMVWFYGFTPAPRCRGRRKCRSIRDSAMLARRGIAWPVLRRIARLKRIRDYPWAGEFQCGTLPDHRCLKSGYSRFRSQPWDRLVHEQRDPFLGRSLVARIAAPQFKPAIGAFHQPRLAERDDHPFVFHFPDVVPHSHHAERIAAGFGQMLSRVGF